MNNPEIKIACLGDSITKGRFSYNWIKQLSNEFKEKSIHFFNFGKDGELAFNALQRIDDVINIQPEYVFILLGTNDINAIMCEANTKRYMRGEKLPQRPNIEWYLENIEKITTLLKSKTKAKIVLISIPILGEDLKNIANKTVDKYNEKIKEYSLQNKIAYIDLYQKMFSFLLENSVKNVRPLSLGLGLIFKAFLRRYILFQDWNTISQKHQLLLTTDFIHLNTTSGKMLAEMVKNHIEIPF